MLNSFVTNLSAMSVIFELGFEPKESFFYELTAEQYDQAWQQGFGKDEVLYMLLSPQLQNKFGEVGVVTEEEKLGLLSAVKVIENYCSNSSQSFNNDYKSKLRFVANLLPPVFTDNTSFKQRHLKLVE